MRLWYHAVRVNADRTHSPELLAVLGRRYDEALREHACPWARPRGRSAAPADPAAYARWRDSARAALRELTGLDRMAAELDGHTPVCELGDEEDLGEVTRRPGRIETEPGLWIPFWLLRPHGPGPFPVAITPHGHGARGLDMYAGIVRDDAERERMETEDRDVALEAARRGMLAIAPATRGFAPADIPDLADRHGGRACRSQLMHALLAGRTAIAERVWDVQRLLDWALARPDADGSASAPPSGRVLVTGNSGGGVVTLYAAALDERVTVAAPSCSLAPIVSRGGYVHHCDCNAVPGILRWGEIWDLAALTAPRALIAINGRQDGLFPPAEVDRAVERIAAAYAGCGAPGAFEHRYGAAGHRFYGELMWPLIDRHIQAAEPTRERGS